MDYKSYFAYEIAGNPNTSHSEDAEGLMELAVVNMKPSEEVAAVAREFQEEGLKPFDALHLAFAETGGADVLLTTDDRFLQAVRRLRSKVRVVADNPAAWMEKRRRSSHGTFLH